ncbi:PGN_0703 family putative restriction endonuclease [Arenibaculum sp.]|uniref:PGN_0703 family putative restriction endonuclease n=1 Tax=Arenibaculum sp. TaxID=2865862 RepID=UPI002E155779|nr:hypothetical protein [Arenibaculum sp.]
MNFFGTELAYQIGCRRGGDFPRSGMTEGPHGLRTLPLAHWAENLHPLIRDEAIAYFQRPNPDVDGGISWHRMRAHLLSSQVACVNFLMPFATRPEALVQLLQPLYPGEDIETLPIHGERVNGRPCHLAFEWVGRGNHLDEAPLGTSLTRGANCTSADAMVLLAIGGRTEMLLIEWKYTERYGSPLRNPNRIGTGGAEETANDERRRRYAGRLFWPDGPLAPTDAFGFDDLLCEPLYQLARQQMLAFQLQRAREEGADQVRVLHVAPQANRALNRNTSPSLRGLFPERGVFEVWSGLLAEPTCFVKRNAGQFFGAFDAHRHSLGEWHNDIRHRYASVFRSWP